MSNDEQVLRMLAGASFGPEASLNLPSGRKLDADEAQVMTSLYARDREERAQQIELQNAAIEVLGNVGTDRAAMLAREIQRGMEREEKRREER